MAVVTRDGKASTSYIQRRLQIGYNRAASLMERMEQEGVVGPANHAGKREILVPTEADIIDHARESIAGYKLPKSVEFRAEPLPLAGAMKVLKKDLRAPYWEGQDRAVN